MGSGGQQLHVFFFPMMADGHMIPLMDISRLFALRGVKSTIIVTPGNILHFSDGIDRDKQSGLDISIQTIPFPSAEVGLPEGCENLSAATSPEMFMKFLMAMDMLRKPFEKLLQEHRPHCIVADMFLTWATDVAKNFSIPRIVFHGMNYFALCVWANSRLHVQYLMSKSDSETFVMPGFPDSIEMTKSQLPDEAAAVLMNKIQETEVSSYGVLVNSFYQLEPAYAEYFTKKLGRRAWDIGPVSLYCRDGINKSQRGKKASIDGNFYMRWLDSNEKNSVLYVSFGSLVRFGKAQVCEIAEGLEASGISFIWIVRAPVNCEDNQYLPEGFEERMEGKGLIIRDWAPQVLILDHPATGGFMTHCGWNSTLEAICAGLPLITWPLISEQFSNEKLVTDLLKIGVSAGNKVWRLCIDPDDVFVRKDKIEEVVKELMGNGQAAEERRTRAKELGEMAKKAVEEGGSSYNNLGALIEELRLQLKQKE